MRRGAPLRRTPFKAKAAVQVKRERPPVVLTPLAEPTRAVMAPVKVEPAAAQPKEGRYISEVWRRNVAGIPCVFCGKPSQAAHRNEGKALGLKTDDCLTAAICPPEHAEIDQGKNMTREERRARMNEAIVLTLLELVRRGLIQPTAKATKWTP